MKLTIGKRKALLKALDHIYRTGPSKAHLGICWSLQDVLKYRGKLDAYAFVAKVSMLWPRVDKAAMVHVFPDGVSGVSWPIRRQYDADGYRLPYWEGDQLSERTALLEFLIDYLKNYKE